MLYFECYCLNNSSVGFRIALMILNCNIVFFILLVEYNILLMWQLEPRWDFQEAVRRGWIPYDMTDQVSVKCGDQRILFVRLTMCLSVCLSVRVTICLPVWLRGNVSVCPIIYMSVCPCGCMLFVSGF